MWHYAVDLVHARLVVEVFSIGAGSTETTLCVGEVTTTYFRLLCFGLCLRKACVLIITISVCVCVCVCVCVYL
jgi:hypothetical protein